MFREFKTYRFFDKGDSEGRTIDTRPFFPISPYLAVADFIVKMKNDTLDEAGIKQVMEGLTGSQIRAGASGRQRRAVAEPWSQRWSPRRPKAKTVHPTLDAAPRWGKTVNPTLASAPRCSRTMEPTLEPAPR